MIPSIKTLKNKLNLSEENARKLRQALVVTNHESVDAALELGNAMLQGCGVESLTAETHIDGYYQNIVALYVNMGDTYSTTLLYDTEKGEFKVISWGDWVESQEKSGRYSFA